MDQQQVLVSVIVPIYGTQAYLPACIESIAKQSYPHLQIILVDDESPDGCPGICDEYAKRDSRIKVIHQKNGGVSRARNTGMNHATGAYLMFVDSDDELYEDAVKILLEDAQSYEADLVWAPQKGTGNKGSYEEGAYIVHREDSMLRLSLNGGYNTNAVWGKLFKADLVKDIRFEEGKNINEDGFFMFQCYLKKPLLVQHNVAAYRYNVRADSCSRQKFSEKYLSMLYFSDKKRELALAESTAYIREVHNMEVRTHLQMLDLLCSTTDKAYREVQKRCISKVRQLHKDHKPINKHHKQLEWIVLHGLYPLYKQAFRLKYCR